MNTPIFYKPVECSLDDHYTSYQSGEEYVCNGCVLDKDRQKIVKKYIINREINRLEYEKMFSIDHEEKIQIDDDLEELYEISSKLK